MAPLRMRSSVPRSAWNVATHGLSGNVLPWNFAWIAALPRRVEREPVALQIRVLRQLVGDRLLRSLDQVRRIRHRRGRDLHLAARVLHGLLELIGARGRPGRGVVRHGDIRGPVDLLHLPHEAVREDAAGLLLVRVVRAGPQRIGGDLAADLDHGDILLLGLAELGLDEGRLDAGDEHDLDVAVQEAVAAGGHLVRIALGVTHGRGPADALDGLRYGVLGPLRRFARTDDLQDAGPLLGQVDVAPGGLGRLPASLRGLVLARPGAGADA